MQEINDESLRKALRVQADRPVNKQRAYAALAGILGSIPESQEKWEVLAYFLPRPTPAARLKAARENSHRWVELAVDPKEVREALQYVYSAPNGDLVATDGHRMHVAENVNLPDGFYSSQDSTVKILNHLTFPDYSRPLNQGTFEDIEYKPEPLTVKGRVVELEINGKRFNRRFIEEASAGMVKPRTLMNEYGILRFEEGERIALVMEIK